MEEEEGAGIRLGSCKIFIGQNTKAEMLFSGERRLSRQGCTYKSQCDDKKNKVAREYNGTISELPGDEGGSGGRERGEEEKGGWGIGRRTNREGYIRERTGRRNIRARERVRGPISVLGEGGTNVRVWSGRRARMERRSCQFGVLVSAPVEFIDSVLPRVESHPAQPRSAASEERNMISPASPSHSEPISA